MLKGERGRKPNWGEVGTRAGGYPSKRIYFEMWCSHLTTYTGKKDVRCRNGVRETMLDSRVVSLTQVCCGCVSYNSCKSLHQGRKFPFLTWNK